MTWHQWHHTASRSRMTKRFSVAARVNRSSPHSLHLTPSDAWLEAAASAAMAKAAIRTSFMAAPGSAGVSTATRAPESGLRLFAMSRHCETAEETDAQVDASECPAALTSSRSTDAAPGPAIASHMKAAK